MDSALIPDGYLGSEMWNNVTNDSISISTEYLNPQNSAQQSTSFASKVTLCVLLLFLCTIGNTLVLYVTCRHRQLRTVANFLLGNLAWADLCMALLHTGPNIYLLLTEEWIFGIDPLGQHLCKAFSYMRSVSYHGSIHILMLIAAERFMAVVRPSSQCFLLSSSGIRLAVFMAWILSFIASIPNALFSIAWRHEYSDGGSGTIVQNMCIRDYTNPAIHWAAYDICLFVFWFVLPLSMMITSFILVENELKRHAAAKQCSSIEVKEKIMNNRSTNDCGSLSTQSATDSLLSESLINNLAVSYSGGKSEKNFSSKQRFLMPRSKDPSLPECCKEKTSWSNCFDSAPFELQATSLSAEECKSFVRVLQVMVAVFFICWLPMHLRKMVFYTLRYSPWHGYLPLLTDWLVVIHGTVNPIIYLSFSAHFRMCVREVFR